MEPARKTHIDVLRGLAIAGMVLTHCVQHYMYHIPPEKGIQPGWLDKTDFLAARGIEAFNVSFAVFALLVGYTFVLARQKAPDESTFTRRYLHRLLGLVLCAFVNSLFFPSGDVLWLLALAGGVLWITRKWNPRVTMGLALLLLMRPLTWFESTGDWVIPTEWNYKIQRAVFEGRFLNMCLTNALWGQGASFFLNLHGGRVAQTLAMALWGAAVSRKGLLEDKTENRGFWSRGFVAAFVLFAACFGINKLPALEGTVMVRIVYGWQRVAQAGFLIAAFMLLWRTPICRKAGRAFEALGSMSLSNYIAQSILGCFIFFPVGLNLAQKTGGTASLCIGILLVALLAGGSYIWKKYLGKGPVERLLRFMGL